MRVAWLSLDKDENQVDRFLSYWSRLCKRLNIRSAARLHNCWRRHQALTETVLTSLINDLDTCGKEITLALDDYQFISSQAVHDLVAFLLEHCPKTFHLVIATRSDPPLP